MNTRGIILQNALELFAELGYQASPTAEICIRSGITKPSLYHHFGSKLGLLKAVLAEGLSALIAQLDRACLYQHDITRNLEDSLRLYLRFSRQNAQLYRLQLSLRYAPTSSESYQAVNPWIQEQLGLLQELFAQAAMDHGNMRGRSRAYANSFLGMVNVYAQLNLEGDLTDEDALVYRACHQFMHGIFS